MRAKKCKVCGKTKVNDQCPDKCKELTKWQVAITMIGLAIMFVGLIAIFYFCAIHADTIKQFFIHK